MVWMEEPLQWEPQRLRLIAVCSLMPTEGQNMGAAATFREFSSYSFHTVVSAPATSCQSEMDRAIVRLREGARSFVKLGIEERIALARSMQEGFLRVADRMVAAGCRAKGITPGTPLEAEEWVGIM